MLVQIAQLIPPGTVVITAVNIQFVDNIIRNQVAFYSVFIAHYITQRTVVAVRNPRVHALSAGGVPALEVENGIVENLTAHRTIEEPADVLRVDKPTYPRLFFRFLRLTLIGAHF